MLRVSADAPSDLERFLREPGSADFLDKLFIHQTRYDGQSVYAVLYGEFANYAAAKAVLDALPAAVKRHQPVVRSVRQLRATMDESS